MFTKLDEHSWMKTEVPRGRSTQECFQGLREELGGAEPPSFFMTIQGVTPLLLSRTSCTAGNGRFWIIHRTNPI